MKNLTFYFLLLILLIGQSKLTSQSLYPSNQALSYIESFDQNDNQKNKNKEIPKEEKEETIKEKDIDETNKNYFVNYAHSYSRKSSLDYSLSNTSPCVAYDLLNDSYRKEPFYILFLALKIFF